jgi:hypothetical protein
MDLGCHGNAHALELSLRVQQWPRLGGKPARGNHGGRELGNYEHMTVVGTQVGQDLYAPVLVAAPIAARSVAKAVLGHQRVCQPIVHLLPQRLKASYGDRLKKFAVTVQSD